jgi:hypothetical protein
VERQADRPGKDDHCRREVIATPKR